MININSILESLETSNTNISNNKSIKEKSEDFSKIFEKELSLKDKNKYINKESKNPMDKTKSIKEITKEHVEDNWLTKEEDKTKMDIKDEVLALMNELWKLVDKLGLQFKNQENFEQLKLDMDFQLAKFEQLIEENSFEYSALENIMDLIEYIEEFLIEIKTIRPSGNELETIDEFPLELEEVEVLLNQIKETIENTIPYKQQGKSTDSSNSNTNKESPDEFDLVQKPLEAQEKSEEWIQSLENEPDLGDESIINDIVIGDTQELLEERVEFNDSPNNPLLEIVDREINTTKNIEGNKEELKEINHRDIFKQIVEEAKLNLDDFKQEIRLKLKPEILGELMLKMEMEKGSILAKIMVDNYRTKEIIEANLYQLKEDMRENGLDIKTFEVFVGTNEDFEREGDLDFNSNKKQNKSPTKLKIKNKELIEKEIYMQNTLPIANELNKKGSINLLA